MQSSIHIPRLKKNLTMRNLAKARANCEIQQHRYKLGIAIHFDSEGLSEEEQMEILQSEYDFCLKDIKKGLKKWDKLQRQRQEAYGDDLDEVADNFYQELIRKYCAKTGRKMKSQLKKMDALLAKAKCDCWRHEYNRLTILFSMLLEEAKRSGLKLSDSIERAIIGCYGYIPSLYRSASPQEKRIASLQENKEKAKGPERKRIMGLVIDNLMLAASEHAKSAKSNTRHTKRDTAVHLKRAVSSAIDKWSKYSPNKKKMKTASLRQHQNVRRRYFPEGISREPVIQYVVRKIEQGDTAELKESKTELKGERREECAVTVAEAEILYESIETLYKESLKPKGPQNHVVQPTGKGAKLRSIHTLGKSSV